MVMVVTADAGDGPESVTVRTGTVTVLLGTEGPWVTVTVTGAVGEPWPREGTPVVVQVDEPASGTVAGWDRPGVTSEDGRPREPGSEAPGVTVRVTTGTMGWVEAGTVTKTVGCSVVVLVQVVSLSTSNSRGIGMTAADVSQAMPATAPTDALRRIVSV